MPDTPQYFEQSGADPGTSVGSSLPDPADKAEKTQALQDMVMTEHLKELRYRVIFCVITLMLTFSIGFSCALPIIQLFQGMAPKSVLFIQRAPGEVLMSSVMIMIYVGLALGLPMILYHTLRFILPGLVGKEKVLVTWGIIAGTTLFCIGVIFSYFFLVPSALIFLIQYGQSVASPELSIREYIGFCASLMFTTGILFELPMVLFFLSFTGLVTSKRLIQEWRWAMVFIFIAAAIVTPTQDPLSMSIVAAAMVMLYGLSIVPIKLMNR